MENRDWSSDPVGSFDDFLESRQYSEKSKTNYKSIFYDLLCFLARTDTKLELATDRTFNAWLENKAICDKTGIRYLSFISSILDEMFNDGAIDENFAKLLIDKKSKIKRGKSAKRLPVALDEKQFNLLIGKINDGVVLARARTVVLILIGCGLRVSELCNLMAKHVHLHEERPYLRVIGKADKEREVPIPEDILGDLIDHESRLPALDGYFIGVERNGLITKYSTSGVYRMVNGFIDAAGIEKDRKSPHVLRHTYATRQLQAGIPISTLKLWLGHDSIATTMIYEHSVAARTGMRPKF